MELIKKSLKNKAIIVSLLTVFLLMSTGRAQETTINKTDRGWFTIGVGTGTRHNISTVINANFGRKHVFQWTYYRSQNVDLDRLITLGKPDNLNSFAVSYCFSAVSRYKRLAISAGPSFVFGKITEDNFEVRDDFRVIGLLLNLQTIFSPIKEIGVGLDFYYNFNPVIHFGGVALTFVVEDYK